MGRARSRSPTLVVRSDRRSRSTGSPSRGRLVWGLAVTQTVSWGVLYYALPVLLVPMHDDLGWSRATIVGAFSVGIVISGFLAPLVGRRLDRSEPRLVITAGSLAAVVLVVGWSQVRSPVAFYAVWVGIGIVMAVVLYEAAFVVLIKRCAPDHNRSILTVTLTAGLASFIFQPLTSTLTTSYGWRTALLILAAVLGLVTVPVHWLVLAADPTAAPPNPALGTPRLRGMAELAEGRFWALTAAFSASAAASFTTVVLLVAYLTDQGWPIGRAALVTGVLGAMQLPGRLAFGPLASRLQGRTLAPLLFLLPGAGLALLLVARGGGLVWAAVTLLGIGQGASILLRPKLLVELYGADRIGVVSGVTAVPVTTIRALAPVAAFLLVASMGGYAVVFAGLMAFSAAAALLSRLALPAPPQLASAAHG